MRGVPPNLVMVPLNQATALLSPATVLLSPATALLSPSPGLCARRAFAEPKHRACADSTSLTIVCYGADMVHHHRARMELHLQVALHLRATAG